MATLNPIAVALQGIGFEPLDIAVHGLLPLGIEPPVQEGDEASPHGRIRRARHAADFQPDWLLEALNPPKPPRRTRKRRQADLLILS